MRLTRLSVLFLAAASGLCAARFAIESVGKIVRVADPQISPDGKTIALVVSRTNFEDDRYDPELVLIEVATRAQRVMTHDRRGLTQPRWSANGNQLAFLATVDGKPQVFLMSVDGGDAWQLTKSATGVQQFAWRPGAGQIAYVATDEAPKVTGEERHNHAFEIRNNHFLLQEAPRPAHVWLIAADGKGAARRLTSGEWTLPLSLPPGPPSSPLSWSPDGKRLAVVRVATPYTGDSDKSVIQLLDVDTGVLRAFSGRTRLEGDPLFSPDGRHLAHWYPRDGETRNGDEIYVGPSTGGDTASVTRALDRNVARAIWMPDGHSLLVSANDGATTGAMDPAFGRQGAAHCDGRHCGHCPVLAGRFGRAERRDCVDRQRTRAAGGNVLPGLAGFQAAAHDGFQPRHRLRSTSANPKPSTGIATAFTWTAW